MNKFELSDDQMKQAQARSAERQAGIIQARAEEARKKALAGNEDTGLMGGDTSARIAAREDRVMKEQGTIETLLRKITGGFK